MDKRWENVFATIGEPPLLDDAGDREAFETLVQFKISVSRNGWYHWVTEIVSKKDLADFNGDLYKLILDKLVERMDLALSEKESTDGRGA